MHTNRLGTWAIALAAGVISAPASAGYFGVAVAQNKVDDWNEAACDADAFNFDGSLSGQKCENTDNGFRVFGGFGQNPNFVVEIGYSDFGEATFDAESDGSSSGSGGYPAGPVSVDASVTGFDVSLVGRIPVSDSFDVTARLGMLKWDSEFDARVSGGSASESDDGTDILFGAGLQFALSDSMSVRGEFTRYDIDGTDLDSLSLSLVFSGGN